MTTGRQSGYPNIRKAAYHDLVKQLNAGFTNIWLYRTPYTLHRPEEGAGPRRTGRPAKIPFGNYMPEDLAGRALAVWLQSST